ncbi:MAG TPA: glucose 1-dehydrogenase [Bryobacteraceae bacterium]|nr:glucose 1-dehydrogenase [Bryobacteraceae bacterium]
MSLEGKVALVTGAGRGIGRGIALELAAHGAAVLLHYNQSAAGALAVADTITNTGGRALTHQCDIRDVAAVEAMVARAADEFGRLDILVNNAGRDTRRPWGEVDEAFWDEIIGANLKGAFFCAQSAAKVMARAGWGRIINISSVHAQTTLTNLAVYAASKGGMEAMTRQMALDLGPLGITVNAVAPGCVQVEKNTFDPAERGAEIPLGRVGQPRDVASLVAYLASDDAGWITGQVVTVDGGSTARLFLVLPQGQHE